MKIFFYRVPFPCGLLHPPRISSPEHCRGTKRGLFHRSLLHGHASQHNYQRPLHAGHATLRRISCHQHTLLVDMDEVSIDGALCLPEHADCGVWGGDIVSFLICSFTQI